MVKFYGLCDGKIMVRKTLKRLVFSQTEIFGELPGNRCSSVLWLVIVSDGKIATFKKIWSSILPMCQILNIFLIKTQYTVYPNVAFKKIYKKKINYRENVLIHSIVYNFTI